MYQKPFACRSLVTSQPLSWPWPHPNPSYTAAPPFLTIRILASIQKALSLDGAGFQGNLLCASRTLTSDRCCADDVPANTSITRTGDAGQGPMVSGHNKQEPFDTNGSSTMVIGKFSNSIFFKIFEFVYHWARNAASHTHAIDAAGKRWLSQSSSLSDSA